MSNKLDKHKQICERLRKIYRNKNQDYGDSVSQTYERYGLTAFDIRLTDKLERFRNLIDKRRRVEDETIKETLRDLANYAIIALIEMEASEGNDR